MDNIKKVVRDNYGEIARRAAERQDDGIVTRSNPEADGCGQGELEAVPEGANMGLGCGNPTVIAGLKPGETVLDLGSGGGSTASSRRTPSGRRAPSSAWT
jgi:hypothetical protein